MVEKSETNNELSVAILLEDVTSARSLASSFRKLGVLPIHYESLENFWIEVEGDLPDLVVVDVRKMSEGDLLLIDHKLVKNESLSLVFYYDDSSIPLVNSTYDIFNYGSIRKSLNYDGQLKTILARFNRFFGHYEANEILKQRVNLLQTKNGKLVGEIHDYKEREDFDRFLEELVNRVSERSQTDDFDKAILDILCDWQEVQSVGMYELTANCQRLVSSTIKHNKFVQLPALWLGQVCRNGVEFFAENMASNVAMDLIGKGGKNVVTLRVHGLQNSAELLFFLRLSEEYIPNFNWPMLEKMLSSVYRLSLLKKQINNKAEKKNIFTPWEMIEFLDVEYAKGDAVATASDKQLVVVNFDKLFKTIKERPKLRFNWTQFYKDFLFYLERNIDCSYIVSHWGVENLTFIIERKSFEEFFISLKSLSDRFSYWRYFEDSALVLAVELAPAVEAVPFSPMAYLRHVERDRFELSSAISKVATKASNIFNDRVPLDV